MTSDGTPHGLAAMFRQGVWWKTKDSGFMRIAGMDDRHRINTARFLLRKAAGYAEAVGFSELGLYADAPDDVVDSWMAEDDARLANPQGWIQTTPLYRALVAGLQVDARTDDEMARQAHAQWTERVAEIPNVLHEDHTEQEQ